MNSKAQGALDYLFMHFLTRMRKHNENIHVIFSTSDRGMSFTAHGLVEQFNRDFAKRKVKP